MGEHELAVDLLARSSRRVACTLDVPMMLRTPCGLSRLCAVMFSALLATPAARAADPPASPLLLSPAVAPDDSPAARQSRPLAAWSPAVTLTSRVEQLPEGPALSLSPAIAIGLFNYLESGRGISDPVQRGRHGAGMTTLGRSRDSRRAANRPAPAQKPLSRSTSAPPASCPDSTHSSCRRALSSIVGRTTKIDDDYCQSWSQNAAKHEGVNKCDNCGVEVVKPQRHTKGVKPPGNEGHVDHATARAKGGSGTPDNGQVLCRGCNLQKGSQ